MAVIGTGASAVQFIPEIAPQVAELTVFQRTGNWFLPRKNLPYPNAVTSAVKKVPGVSRVVNNIEILPVSISDDGIRRAVFRAIYSDDFLQKYGTPILGMSAGRWGRNPWGRGLGGFGFGRGFGGLRGFANFPGSEPIGNYAIHIVVKNGRVGLFGTVHSEADKIKAGMDARGVFGVMDVDNELQVVTD